MSIDIVSVITPSFNRADLVMETAYSIMKQTYSYWEWIIVDDGSNDNSWEVIQQLADKDQRIKVFQREREPKGACTCRNIAVEKSSGKYLIFLDTDDILAPFCIEQRVKAITKKNDYDFIIFPMLLFKKEINDLNILWNINNEKDDLHRILAGDAICQGTGTIWKKDSFIKVGMWREDLHLWQDIELHIRSLLFPVKFEKRFDLLPDVYLRVTDGSLSRSGYYSLPKIRSRIDVFSYSCKRIKEKNLIQNYSIDLRNIALDVAMSALKASQFKQALITLTIAESYGLLKPNEIKKIIAYLWIHRFKLYKIKSLDSYYSKRINQFSKVQSSNIGQIRWDISLINSSGYLN